MSWSWACHSELGHFVSGPLAIRQRAFVISVHSSFGVPLSAPPHWTLVLALGTHGREQITSCPHRGYVLMREEGMNKE